MLVWRMLLAQAVRVRSGLQASFTVEQKNSRYISLEEHKAVFAGCALFQTVPIDLDDSGIEKSLELSSRSIAGKKAVNR